MQKDLSLTNKNIQSALRDESYQIYTQESSGELNFDLCANDPRDQFLELKLSRKKQLLKQQRKMYECILRMEQHRS